MAVSAAVFGGIAGYAQPASAEPDIGLLTDYGFQCVDIPGPPTLVHWRDCNGDRGDVPAGHYVRVTNVSSGR